MEVTLGDEHKITMKLKYAFGFIYLIIMPSQLFLVLTILGEFNAISSCDRAAYEMSVVPMALELIPASESSFLLWDPHSWTKYSDMGVQNWRVYPSAEFCGTNHRQVVATFESTSKPLLSPVSTLGCFTWTEGGERRFDTAISNGFAVLEGPCSSVGFLQAQNI